MRGGKGKVAYQDIIGVKLLSIVDCKSELAAVADFGFFESTFTTVTNSYSLWCLVFKCFCISDILFWGRVSAASTTARWSRRVDSADHPGFRSYFFGKLRKVRVPYRTVKCQYFYHVVQGYLPIFKIPR